MNELTLLNRQLEGTVYIKRVSNHEQNFYVSTIANADIHLYIRGGRHV